MSRKDKLTFFVLRSVGNFCVLLTIYALLATFGPLGYQEASYRYRKMFAIRYVIAGDVTPTPVAANPGQRLFAAVSGGDVQHLKPVDTDFGVVIPKIGANVKVIPNVDPGNYVSYMFALQQGVAHAAGSGLPGQDGPNRRVYLFAHSTDYPWNVSRYNAVFYLLKELDPGDEIDVYFSGHRHIYIVNEKRQVGPDEVQFLTKPQSIEDLVLQTCWPPGTTFKRLLVFASPKKA